MAKELHSFDGNEVIATELPQYLNQNFTAIPSNMGVWEKNEAVEVGDIRFLSGRENTGYMLECIASGTTGVTQPTIVEESAEILANYSDSGVVGRMRLIFNPAEKDIDEVYATGVVYSRSTYPELWEYAQLRAGLVIGEEEWQAKFIETNGKFVPYYSRGDGSTTFRTPLLGGYLKGATDTDEIGDFKEAGLPALPDMSHTHTRGTMDITGRITMPKALTDYATMVDGAFSIALQDSSTVYGTSGTVSDAKMAVTLNASKSWTGETSKFISPSYDALYGGSDTVTPETMTGVWVIKAIGVILGAESTSNVDSLIEGIESTQRKVSTLEDNVKDIVPIVPIDRGGTNANNGESACINIGALGYRTLDSIQSVNGSFLMGGYGDSVEGIPSVVSNWDWILLQLGHPEGIDKVQFLLSSDRMLRRYDDSSLGNETWTSDSWENMYFVKETYKSGTNWYRVWSDGWIEQGGLDTTTYSGSNGRTITFHKAFTSNVCSVIPVLHNSYTSNATGVTSVTVSLTNFTVKANNGVSNKGTYWYACGY